MSRPRSQNNAIKDSIRYRLSDHTPSSTELRTRKVIINLF
ncbi:hypothetical protein VPMS16_2293 [Vibrio sp. 16]|nr:hypothetical protein VPMS16_2293 [Vibrio sp. 16]